MVGFLNSANNTNEVTVGNLLDSGEQHCGTVSEQFTITQTMCYLTGHNPLKLSLIYLNMAHFLRYETRYNTI